MLEGKYTLTISILASNRKDTLPKTLESIKPILDNVSSELIVTDTGCDEDLLDIIRQYTDKIIKFQWCNDFAKARNVGLESASGQWFMFIDDDEWFENASEIINFFNSTEKEKYGYARYIVRNYKNLEGTSYLDAAVGRIFCIRENSKFKGIIHETIDGIYGETKQFTSYAHHYGYVHKTEKDKKAHTERNVSLLIKQVELEPKIAHHYAHLAQEYATSGDGDEAMNVALKGIECADKKDESNRKDISGLYAVVVWNLLNHGKYKEAFEKSKEYMDSPYCNKLCEATLYGYMAVMAYWVKDYSLCLRNVFMFAKLKEYFDTNEIEKHNQTTVMLVYTLEATNCLRVMNVGIDSAIAMADIIGLINSCVICKKLGQSISEVFSLHVNMEQWRACVDKWSVSVKIKEAVVTMQTVADIIPSDSQYMNYLEEVFAKYMEARRR